MKRLFPFNEALNLSGAIPVSFEIDNCVYRFSCRYCLIASPGHASTTFITPLSRLCFTGCLRIPPVHGVPGFQDLAVAQDDPERDFVELLQGFYCRCNHFFLIFAQCCDRLLLLKMNNLPSSEPGGWSPADGHF